MLRERKRIERAKPLKTVARHRLDDPDRGGSDPRRRATGRANERAADWLVDLILGCWQQAALACHFLVPLKDAARDSMPTGFSFDAYRPGLHDGASAPRCPYFFLGQIWV